MTAPFYERVSAEELRSAHHDEGLSLRRIGERYGVSEWTVRDAMIRLGVERKRVRYREVPPEELEALYHGENLTVKEVAERVGLPDYVVQRQLEQAGIERHSKGFRSRRVVIKKCSPRCPHWECCLDWPVEKKCPMVVGGIPHNAD